MQWNSSVEETEELKNLLKQASARYGFDLSNVLGCACRYTPDEFINLRAEGHAANKNAKSVDTIEMSPSARERVKWIVDNRGTITVDPIVVVKREQQYDKKVTSKRFDYYVIEGADRLYAALTLGVPYIHCWLYNINSRTSRDLLLGAFPKAEQNQHGASINQHGGSASPRASSPTNVSPVSSPQRKN